MPTSVMSTATMYLFVYGIPVIIVIAYMILSKRRAWARNREILEDNVKAGLTEPASLHPLIDQTRCIGCGVCVPACPEGNVLGLIDGKVQMINATKCIGHGQCKIVCPMDAITLVFGTAKRGIDIPNVDENFQTDVDGIYIAGELGGMGLVRNAVAQGRLAMEAIGARPGIGGGGGDMLDVVVIGAGPAGLTASLSAKLQNLNYLTIEQECLGGSVAHFPRGKVVQTVPWELPGVGKFNFRLISKEELLEVWTKVERQSGVKIQYNEKMDTIKPIDGGHVVVTPKGEYKTKTVLLAIGRRGTPRKLGVPGEEGSPKVIYALTDPEMYRGKKILVVGGGNSALEAAYTLGDEPGTTVALSYRSDSFSRSTKKNRDKIDQSKEEGTVNVLLKSVVKEITPESVILEQEGKRIELPNELIIVNAGGILPTPFLKEIGILVETKHGTA